MSRVIVEDCLKISISTVNENIGAEAKRFILDLHALDIMPDYPVNDKGGLPHQWGLNDFFSVEKPEWMDTDEWVEDTTFNESILLWLPGVQYNQGTLRITASPLHKNQLIFTHAGRKTDGTEKSYVVNLTKAGRKYGGFTYYFQCPLGHDGSPCHRDVSMLYLPPGATYFGCRHCYNLSYACRNASRPGRIDRAEYGVLERMVQLYYEDSAESKESKGGI